MDCSDARGTQSSADLAEEDATAYAESSDFSNSQFSNALSAALRQFNGEPPRTGTTSAGSSSGVDVFPLLEVPDGHQNQAQDAASELGDITTVMVKNVPVKCGQRRLLRQFLAAGFQGKLDFIYLPMDPRSRSSRGFAFVNLTSVESAHQFYRTFHGRFLKNYPSEIPLEVAVAEIQGFDANAEHYLLVKASRKGKGRDVFGCPTFLRPLQRHLVNHLRTLEEPKQPKSKSSEREEASIAGSQDGQESPWQLRGSQQVPAQYPMRQTAVPQFGQPPYLRHELPASGSPVRPPVGLAPTAEQLLARLASKHMTPNCANGAVIGPPLQGGLLGIDVTTFLFFVIVADALGTFYICAMDPCGPLCRMGPCFVMTKSAGYCTGHPDALGTFYICAMDPCVKTRLSFRAKTHRREDADLERQTRSGEDTKMSTASAAIKQQMASVTGIAGNHGVDFVNGWRG
ncbi:TE1 [Symbiodinium natans]|uniref:TE1 protein n=1 Tax=Symbiodinium natans TaxID=878477 RepID=A0A812QM04_9DINO|nr:TE1 [Symbiodinium natans]